MRETFIRWDGSDRPSFSSRGLVVGGLPAGPHRFGYWTPQTSLISKTLQNGAVVVECLFLMQKASLRRSFWELRVPAGRARGGGAGQTPPIYISNIPWLGKCSVVTPPAALATWPSGLLLGPSASQGPPETSLQNFGLSAPHLRACSVWSLKTTGLTNQRQNAHWDSSVSLDVTKSQIWAWGKDHCFANIPKKSHFLYTYNCLIFPN